MGKLTGWIVLCLPMLGFSWAGDEHQEIGDTSIRAACGEYRASKAVARICDHYDHGTGPTFYGQLNKLFADHISGPERFLGLGAIGGLSESNDNVLAMLAALDNADHFYPISRKIWSEYHNKALRCARRPGFGSDPEAMDSAMMYNAFADHFLQDSYVTGHMGQNRRMSTHLNSYLHHNYFNEKGRKLYFPTGDSTDSASGKLDSIYGYGDGELNGSQESKKAYRKFVLENTKRSLAELFYVIANPESASGADMRPVEIRGFENGRGRFFDIGMIPTPVAMKYDFKLTKRFIYSLKDNDPYFEARGADLDYSLPWTQPLYLKVSMLAWIGGSFNDNKQNREENGWIPVLGAGYNFTSHYLPISSSLEIEYLFPNFFPRMNRDAAKPWFFVNDNVNLELLDFAVLRFTAGLGMANPARRSKIAPSTYYASYAISVSSPITAKWLSSVPYLSWFNPFYLKSRYQ